MTGDTADRGPMLALVGEGFLSRLSFGVVSFALPLYAHRMGLGLASIGLLLGSNLAVALVLKVPLGHLADRFGYRRALVAAITLRSLVVLLLVVATVPWHLFAIRGLHGISIALRDPATASLIAVHGGKQRIATSFAWYQTAKTAAGSFGKAVAGFVLGLAGASFPIVFLVAAVLSLLPLAVVVRSRLGSDRIIASRPADRTSSHEERAVAAGNGWPDGVVVAAAVLGLLVTGTAYLMTNLLPILAIEHAGLTEAQTGTIFLLAGFAGLGGPAFGWLADRVSHRLVLSLRSLANLGSSVLYLLAPSFAGFATARFADDLGKAAFKPAWGALMARVSARDPRHRARSMSIVSLGEDAGELIGPVVAGLLWSTWGVGVLLGARIGLAIVAEVYALRVDRRLGNASGRRHREEASPEPAPP